MISFKKICVVFVSTLILVGCAMTKGNASEPQTLLNEETDVNARDNFGWSALHIASKRGDGDVVKILLDRGSNVNETVYAGEITSVEAVFDRTTSIIKQNTGIYATALQIATEYGHSNVVRILCNRGANVNLAGLIGETPLYIASFKGYSDIAKILLDKGADINIKSGFVFTLGPDGSLHFPSATALYAATKQGHKGIAELLKRAGAVLEVEQWLEPEGRCLECVWTFDFGEKGLQFSPEKDKNGQLISVVSHDQPKKLDIKLIPYDKKAVAAFVAKMKNMERTR